MAEVKFKFAEVFTFKEKVTIVTPGGEEQTFLGEFLYLDDKATEELVKLETAESLRQVWTGWSGIVFGEGDEEKELPYSAPQRELFLVHAYVTNAVLFAYLRARQGLRAKN